MSNAFVKSMAITMTYGFEINSRVIWSRRVIMAAVVDPVGRKANWSPKSSDEGASVEMGR